jgi:excisionase family DNA binding protein
MRNITGSTHLKWFAVSEAAQFVGVNVSAIRRAIREGRLRVTPFPGHKRWRRIPKEDLVALQRMMENNLRFETDGR